MNELIKEIVDNLDESVERAGEAEFTLILVGEIGSPIYEELMSLMESLISLSKVIKEQNGVSDQEAYELENALFNLDYLSAKINNEKDIL